MSTNTQANTNANAGLLAMQARVAAMTPEQRKAASVKAQAASAAAIKARKLAMAANGEVPAKGTTPRPEHVDAPEVEREYRVALLTGDVLAWVSVKAGGLQRAKRAARKAHPGATCVGVVEASIAGLTIG